MGNLMSFDKKKAFMAELKDLVDHEKESSAEELANAFFDKEEWKKLV